jgi:uncharacterized repeat protein (TIGR01451 family)
MKRSAASRVGPAHWLLSLACALALWLAGAGPAAAGACTAGACVSAGPRLASVSTTNSVLLNALIGNLTGTSLNLSVADWNSLATGSLSLASTLNALQAGVGASTPSTALTSNATLAQVLTAAATAATGEGKTSLALALNDLQVPLSLLGGTIRLGDLLTTDGALSSTHIDALELVTGVIQLYNMKNVLTTPSPLTLSGAALGLSGVATSVTLAAQVVEPPVYVCGPAGSTFHSAAIRVKLGIDLVAVTLDNTLLKLIPFVATASAQIAHLDLYVEIAQGSGVITGVNAVSNAFSVQATPGVASLYLGLMSDSVFFNRAHVLNPSTDLSWSTIGAVTINSLSVSILAKGYATGTAASASNLNFTGPYPQGYTVSAGASFVSTLLSSLAGSLQLSLTAGLGALQTVVTATLLPLVQVAIPIIVQPLVDGLINPLLELLGIGLGEIDVNAEGTTLSCTLAGSVYADTNHSAKMDPGETGTGVALYAKLVLASAPTGPALSLATVDPTSGAYSFSAISPASYLVVINGSSSSSQVTPAPPGGWIGTEAPTQSLAVSVTTANLVALNFGLYHGSSLSGVVFKDNGSGGGTANNGIRDGTEIALVGSAVKVTDATGTTVYDSNTSGNAGAYTLWIPSTASGSLKVTHTPVATWIPVSGNAGTTAGAFALASVSVSFTQVIGSVYSGVSFGDVPANQLQPDGQQQMLPGTVAYFSHSFSAGTAGQVGFATLGTGGAGWTNVLYLDANCNGLIDSGELPLSTTISVVADQKVCLIVKVAAPASAPYNSQYAVALTAHFVYANNTLTGDLQRGDTANVGSATDSGLRLNKVVDKATAASGDTITYTMTYTNQSDAALSSLKILDSTPAYTVFASAACGTLPNAQISCAVTASPTVGGTGHLEWTFTGTLSAGASGTVIFSVLLQ